MPESPLPRGKLPAALLARLLTALPAPDAIVGARDELARYFQGRG